MRNIDWKGSFWTLLAIVAFFLLVRACDDPVARAARERAEREAFCRAESNMSCEAWQQDQIDSIIESHTRRVPRGD